MEQALNSYRPISVLDMLYKQVRLCKERSTSLGSPLNALKSSYHKLWDMNEMYNEGRLQQSFLPTMLSTWMTAAKRGFESEHLLYRSGHTKTESVSAVCSERNARFV